MIGNGFQSAPAVRFIGRTLIIVVSYMVAWRFATMLEVHPNVSALYVPAGLAVTFAVLFGWRYLPVVYLAICLSRMQDFPFTGVDSVDYLGALRQTLVYGLAGLYLRRSALVESFRLSLNVAGRFVGVALVASLCSAVLTLWIPPFDALPPESIGPVFFSFWGGDFAGVMLTVPTILILRRACGTGLVALAGSVFRSVGEYRVVFPLSLAVAVAVFATWLPSSLDSDARLGILVLLPVLLAALKRGVILGFLAAAFASASLLVSAGYFGAEIGSALELQLLLVMASAIALLAGAAHDDMSHEWRRANYDALTGLPNRHMLHDRLDHELRKAHRAHDKVALLYLDLDGFKEVNDSLGHAVGDVLLGQVAERLKRCVRESDTVGRLAGDEFLVILAGLTGHGGVDAVAQKVLTTLAQPFEVASTRVDISASIGIAYYPDDGLSGTELIHMADQAMYAAKGGGRNQVCHRGTMAGLTAD